MTSPLRRKRQTIRPNTAAETPSSSRHPRTLLVLVVGLSLAIPAIASASSATESPSTRSRNIEKAQHTQLRWRPYRLLANRDGQSSPQPAARRQAANRAHRETASATQARKRREQTHLQQEAAHVKQASATKPKDDPFADPFFDDESNEKLKVAPIATQPLRQPRSGDAQPLSPEEQMEAAEQPEPLTSPQELKELAQAPPGELPPCPSASDVKKIREVTTDISAQAGEFPPECSLGDVPFVPRHFAPTTYMFKASGLCSKPLYFQDAALERYGHSWGPIVQPFVSGARFYLTFPILPYLMGVYPPCECQYALGYYRPSSCAPKMCYPFPISLRGGLIETGFIFGAIGVLP